MFRGQMLSVGSLLIVPPRAAVLVHRPATLRRANPIELLKEGLPISPFAWNNLRKSCVSVSKTLAGGRPKSVPKVSTNEISHAFLPSSPCARAILSAAG